MFKTHTCIVEEGAFVRVCKKWEQLPGWGDDPGQMSYIHNLFIFYIQT